MTVLGPGLRPGKALAKGFPESVSVVLLWASSLLRPGPLLPGARGHSPGSQAGGKVGPSQTQTQARTCWVDRSDLHLCRHQNLSP